MVQTYAELVDLLPEVRDQGYVRTHRAGNTGIGKTLEDLLGIRENNFAGPNGHETELKSTRKSGNSMITLFTKSPLPPRINSLLANEFGRDEGRGKQLHTTVNAATRNTLYGKPAFQINVLHTEIRLIHKKQRGIPIPYWNRTNLENAFKKKYAKNLLYVKADSRGTERGEEFHYNEAWLMSGFSFERFIKLLRAGDILVDLRLGRYKNGRLHDHGTGFRIMPENLDRCFDERRRVL